MQSLKFGVRLTRFSKNQKHEGAMEELFRFIMTRPAQKAAAETPSVPVTPNTDYHGRLRRAKVQGLDSVRRVALAQASASSTVHSASDTKFGHAALQLPA